MIDLSTTIHNLLRTVLGRTSQPESRVETLYRHVIHYVWHSSTSPATFCMAFSMPCLIWWYTRASENTLEAVYHAAIYKHRAFLQRVRRHSCPRAIPARSIPVRRIHFPPCRDRRCNQIQCVLHDACSNVLCRIPNTSAPPITF